MKNTYIYAYPLNFKALDAVFTHFSRYIALRDELIARLTAVLEPVHFSRGHLVLDAGKVCTCSYFIQRGMLRAYFLKDGKEITEFFSAEEEWCNSPKSFYTQQPGIYAIDAIEPTDAWAIGVRDLVALFDEFPEMERYARLSMGTVFGHLMERITSLRFTSAREKYQHFLEEYDGIHHRIPLGMVASYLGITQETLSRLRAEK